MKGEMRRKNNSEVLTSNILNQDKDHLQMNIDAIKIFNKINEEQSKDNIFLESFSDIIPKNPKNQIVETLNSEEISVLEGNNPTNLFLKNLMLSSNFKSTNKTLIKIISTKFHDLYLKLANQIKVLKIENNNLKKKYLSQDLKYQAENIIITPENQNVEIIESENETLKYLLQEELECFNHILFDFNVQFNDLQSQEETLRREILKKHKEIEKLNFDIEECKKQKDSFIKELQNIAIKLNEYKMVLPQNFTDNKIIRDELNDSKNELEHSNSLQKEDYDIEEDEFHLLLNSDNREYLVKKILQENKKYKSIVKVMKTEEIEFSNYLMQLEAELENFGKFKNFCLTKVNAVEDNISKLREKLDNITDKVTNVEFQLEIGEDNL